MIQISRDQKGSCHVALHLLINQLSLSVNPAALARQNTLVNDVSPCLLVRTDAQRLGLVLRQLLETLNSNSEKSSIHLSAKISGDVLQLDIRNKTVRQTNNLAGCLLPLKLLAQEFYRTVTITSQRDNVTTLALGFTSQPVAA